MNEEILAEIRSEIALLKERIASLEDKVSTLEGSSEKTVSENEPVMEISLDELLDIVEEPQENEPTPETVEEPQEEPAAIEEPQEVEPEAAQEPQEVEPEIAQVPEPLTDLFGEAIDNSINARHSQRQKKAIVDALEHDESWRRDMPGAPVKNVLSAISLNDRLLFIRSLFADDAAAFSATAQMINSAVSFEAVVDRLKAEHPKWDFNGEAVYRLMMAARRRLG